MREFHYQRAHHHCPTVNLDQLWSLVSEQTRAKASDSKDKVPVIDVTRSGFHKVLGRGVLPKVPVVVKAKFFTKQAEERIKAIGGSCVLTA